METHQRRERVRLGRRRRWIFAEKRRQTHRLRAQLRTHRGFGRRAVIALVEQQVQRAPHGREALREFGVGQIEQPSGAREDLLSPGDPLLDRRAAGEERARDLRRAESAQDVEDQRDLRFLRQPRMTAGEHHPELLIADRVRRERLVDDRPDRLLRGQRRVLRMAGQPHVAGVGHRDDLLQEPGDGVPAVLRRDAP